MKKEKERISLYIRKLRKRRLLNFSAQNKRSSSQVADLILGHFFNILDDEEKNIMEQLERKNDANRMDNAE